MTDPKAPPETPASPANQPPIDGRTHSSRFVNPPDPLVASIMETWGMTREEAEMWADTT
jgi:hypothetical protein